MAKGTAIAVILFLLTLIFAIPYIRIMGRELMSARHVSVSERRERSLSVFFYIALSLTAVIWFAPIIMLIFTALKSAGDFAIHGALAIPKSIAWSNFSDAWDTGVKSYFWNSVIITVDQGSTRSCYRSDGGICLDSHALSMGKQGVYLLFCSA